MKAFDARCLSCGDVYVVWAAFDHDPGDIIKRAHVRTPGACGEYGEHELVATLDGLSKHEKWGDTSQADE